MGEPYTVEILNRANSGWDAIVTSFADMCLEQTACFMSSRWGNSRLSGLVLRRPLSGEPEAAALAVVASIPMIKAGIAYIKFGPLWRRHDKPAHPRVLSSALAAITEHFARARGLLVRIMPPADPEFAKVWLDCLAGNHYALHRPLEHPERYLIDLKLSETEQLASLGSKWRANLRKASPALELREVDPSASLPAFMDLYGRMATRKRFRDHHHIAVVPAFLAAAPKQLNVRMFLASVGERPVSASVIVGCGDRVFVPFSASTEDALPLRAGFALRWFLINSLRGAHARWLDIGGDEGDSGLRHFKVGNVGSAGRIIPIPGEYDRGGRPLSSALAHALTLRALRRRQETAPNRQGDACGQAA